MIKTLYTLLFCLFSIIGYTQTEDLVLKLKVEKVINAETEELLTEVKLTIFGTDGSSRECISDSLGQFPLIDLKHSTSYSTVVSKKGFLNAKGKETTIDCYDSKIMVHEYALAPVHICSLPIPVPVYEFNQSDLKGAKCDNNATKYIVDILTENPNIIVQLNGYRDSTESITISRERAVNFRLSLIKLGIEGDRIKVKDAGIRKVPDDFQWHDESNIDLCNPNRVVLLKVLSTEYGSDDKNK